MPEPSRSTDAPRVFRLPDLGEGLVEAEIVRWLVDPGERIEVDQPVVEVETAKTAVEVPSPYAGTVLSYHGQPGETVAVGAPLITVGEPDARETRSANPVRVLVGSGTTTTAKPTRRRRRVLDADLADRRLMAGTAGTHRIPLTGGMRAAAEKFTRSHLEIPAATTWVDADATDFLAMRDTLRSQDSDRGHPGLLAMLAHVCVQALRRHPELNASIDRDRLEIVRSDEIHLGFAAQTERGLVVPVIRGAGAAGLAELAAEVTRLVATARAGTLSPTELTGGTFTLNNYGNYGVDGATPLLNHPEGGMIGVGRVCEKPWVVDGVIKPRHVVQLSLTFDHRLCDGGTAGRFLRFVADKVENPAAHFERT